MSKAPHLLIVIAVLVAPHTGCRHAAPVVKTIDQRLSQFLYEGCCEECHHSIFPDPECHGYRATCWQSMGDCDPCYACGPHGLCETTPIGAPEGMPQVLEFPVAPSGDRLPAPEDLPEAPPEEITFPAERTSHEACEAPGCGDEILPMPTGRPQLTYPSL